MMGRIYSRIFENEAKGILGTKPDGRRRIRRRKSKRPKNRWK
jgi:hypothetical protein